MKRLSLATLTSFVLLAFLGTAIITTSIVIEDGSFVDKEEQTIPRLRSHRLVLPTISEATNQDATRVVVAVGFTCTACLSIILSYLWIVALQIIFDEYKTIISSSKSSKGRRRRLRQGRRYLQKLGLLQIVVSLCLIIGINAPLSSAGTVHRIFIGMMLFGLLIWVAFLRWFLIFLQSMLHENKHGSSQQNKKIEEQLQALQKKVFEPQSAARETTKQFSWFGFIFCLVVFVMTAILSWSLPEGDDFRLVCTYVIVPLSEYGVVVFTVLIILVIIQSFKHIDVSGKLYETIFSST